MAQLHLLQGDQGAFRSEIQRAVELSEEAGDLSMLEMSLSLLADYHSRMGEHQQALKLMLRMHALRPTSSLTTQITEALLARRRGDLHGAFRMFSAIVATANAQNNALLSARAGLQVVYTVYLMRDYEKTRELLPEALNAVLRFGTPGGPLDLRSDFDELSELFAFAEMEPQSAPVLASLLAQGAEYAGGSADLLSPAVHLELLVLGQQMALKDGVPLSFSLKNTVGVMLYLALYPGRTRREIQLDLFPDKDDKEAGNYVRKCIAEIGKVVGPVVVQEGPHNAPTYQYSPKVSVSSDYQLLRTRLAQDNLPGAVAAYRGELLPGLDDSEWVVNLREEMLGSVRATLNGLIQEAQERGDHARVVLLCTQGLKFDPDDFELAEIRLESARFASTAQEQARFRSEFKRRLN
ncbi:AfsR/SARP family transcriptional regulator [Deinococcus ruber]|nr:bacterial transcriptional activator domain-containing protein [Deinococcus ruber]